ncbi:MAG: aa3-type cytochrome c oxidase subunit IV [Antarcticimicrobium sp.]|nr:aa3-type cytochrome c oxidase subunit IV [Antarcticimicrobium sp.]MDF1718109.1 aa3-type cytochrome c oxidase subunit IV [Antarcticimicrobium sp.]
MAEHKHGEMDISVQTGTFNGFVKFVTWTVALLIVLALFLLIFAS